MSYREPDCAVPVLGAVLLSHGKHCPILTTLVFRFFYVVVVFGKLVMRHSASPVTVGSNWTDWQQSLCRQRVRQSLIQFTASQWLRL